MDRIVKLNLDEALTEGTMAGLAADHLRRFRVDRRVGGGCCPGAEGA